MTHPLTDSFLQSYYKYGDGPYDEDQMRDAYDKGFDDAIECIREAGIAHYSALHEAQENFYNNRNN